MTRVTTGSLQQVLINAIQRGQRDLALTEAQLASGKKAQSLSDLGGAIVPTLSARALLARQDAYAGVSTRLKTTLQMYDASISRLDSMGSTLQRTLLGAIGTGDTTGLQEAIGNAFGDLRTSLNASEAGVPLFGGGRTGDPFVPQTFADVASTPAAQAFANGPVKAAARVADNRDLTYGALASDLGSDLYTAFETLAAAGPIGTTPTPAQLAALKTAVDQLATALDGVRASNADNGRRQAELSTQVAQGEDRANMLRDVVSEHEDADLGEVATQLSQQQALLQASYSTFAKISGLSLADYLR